jgi:hypothetical protein
LRGYHVDVARVVLGLLVSPFLAPVGGAVVWSVLSLGTAALAHYRLIFVPLGVGLFVTIGLYPYIVIGLGLCHWYLSHVNWKTWWAYALIGALFGATPALLNATQSWWSGIGRDESTNEFWIGLATSAAAGASVAVGFWAIAGVSRRPYESRHLPASAES